MNSDVFDWIFLIVVLIGILIASNFFLVHAHERAHQMIFTYYGIDSEIEYNFLNGKTIPRGEIATDNYKFIFGLHALNEIFGYQISAMYNSLFMAVVFIYIFTALRFKGGGA